MRDGFALWRMTDSGTGTLEPEVSPEKSRADELSTELQVRTPSLNLSFHLKAHHILRMNLS